MSERTLDRLDLGARRRGEAKARTAERVIDEGLRMEDHPGIVFRDGPSGRRAALATGPDVLEVIETLNGTGLSGEQAIAATVEWGDLTPIAVRAAVRYYADYRDEIDDRILLNRQEAKRQRAAWERAQERWREAPHRRDVPGRPSPRARARGHDVVAVTARPEMRALPDDSVFATAQQERRSVVTENIGDFSAIVDAADQRRRISTTASSSSTRPSSPVATTHDRPPHHGARSAAEGSFRRRADEPALVGLDAVRPLPQAGTTKPPEDRGFLEYRHGFELRQRSGVEPNCLPLLS